MKHTISRITVEHMNPLTGEIEVTVYNNAVSFDLSDGWLEVVEQDGEDTTLVIWNIMSIFKLTVEAEENDEDNATGNQAGDLGQVCSSH